MQTHLWLGRSLCGILLAIAAVLNWNVRGTFIQLFSLPVAIAALVDGWRGGLAAAVFSSIAVFSMPGDAGVTRRAVDSLVLISLGMLMGMVFDRERREKRRLQKTADQLSSVYEKVQANIEGMKRVERLSAIGQLSAGLAHEIRNPLASIAGAAAILQRSENMDPKHVKCVEIITNECRRLNGLLTNFLNFARPRPPRFQTVNLNSVLDHVLALASHGLRGKTVSCQNQSPPDLPKVQCDPEQLEQVLLNLMINAIEASPNGETVTLSAAAHDGQVAVHVIDHGHGVALSNVDRLFDPFFTTKEHGTGLGLPVAHQITTQMGGTLVAQRNVEKGMTFSVILPAENGCT